MRRPLAILLDEAYYQLLRSGTTVINGVTVLGAAYLIPFKAKAWLDLTARQENVIQAIVDKFQSVEIKDTLKNFSKFFAEDFFERDAIEGMIALT